MSMMLQYNMNNMHKEHMSECELQVSSFNGANEINNPWKENTFMIVGMPPKIWASWRNTVVGRFLTQTCLYNVLWHENEA
jgi:hypothetical protein